MTTHKLVVLALLLGCTISGVLASVQPAIAGDPCTDCHDACWEMYAAEENACNYGGPCDPISGDPSSRECLDCYVDAMIGLGDCRMDCWDYFCL